MFINPGNSEVEAGIKRSSCFVQFFKQFKGSGKVVLEARWKWGLIDDLLEEIEEIEGIEEVVPAHPLKTRLIADAQIHDGPVGHVIYCSPEKWVYKSCSYRRSGSARPK